MKGVHLIGSAPRLKLSIFMSEDDAVGEILQVQSVDEVAKIVMIPKFDLQGKQKTMEESIHQKRPL